MLLLCGCCCCCCFYCSAAGAGLLHNHNHNNNNDNHNTPQRSAACRVSTAFRWSTHAPRSPRPLQRSTHLRAGRAGRSRGAEQDGSVTLKVLFLMFVSTKDFIEKNTPLLPILVGLVPICSQSPRNWDGWKSCIGGWGGVGWGGVVGRGREEMTISDQQSNNVEKEVLALLISATAANYWQLSIQHEPVYRLHG